MNTTLSAKNLARSLTRFCAVGASLAVLLGASNAQAYVDEHVYVIQGNYLHDVDLPSGSYTAIGGEDWANTTSMTFYEGKIYAISGDALWRSTWGGYQQVTGEDWPGATLMTVAETGEFTAPGTGGSIIIPPQPISAIYVIQDSYLWQVEVTESPLGATETPLGGAAWINPTSMHGWGTSIYVVEGDVLWHVDATDGSYTALGGAIWDGPTHMTHYGSSLYIAQNTRIYKVNPSTGAIQAQSSTGWGGTTSLAAMLEEVPGSYLYAIQDDKLWRINPSTFATTAVTGAIWPGQTFIAPRAYDIPE